MAQLTYYPITPPPGLWRNGTKYQAKGRWYDANLVRFFSGTIQPIGGWQSATLDGGATLGPLTGVPRGAIAWRLDDGSIIQAFATNSKVYAAVGTALHDITPTGFTAGQADGASVSGTGNYSYSTYGTGNYGVGDIGATFKDADTWTLDVFGYYLVALCTSDGLLYVWSGDPSVAMVPITANQTAVGTTPSTTGGTLAAGTYYYTVTAVTPYGELLAAAEHSATTTGTTSSVALSWTAFPSATSYKIYRGAAAAGEDGYFTSATNSYTDTGATRTVATMPTNYPTTSRAVVCTPERFLVVLGADGDVRKVKWASQEDVDTWAPLSTDTAGSFPLTTQGRLLAGQRVSGQTLLFTDNDLWSMTYIGGTLVYSFTQVGANCGLVAPNAKATMDTVTFWMGVNNFYAYNGYVQAMPCDVWDAVFSNFNASQRAKTFAVTNSQFGEIFWFYCSASSIEIDSYVVYNVRERHWTTGMLNRTAGFDVGATSAPVWCDSSGNVYQQEIGTGRGTIAYLESGPIELGDGNQLIDVQSLISDENTLGDVQAKLYTAYYPTSAETETGAITLTAPTPIRAKGRQVRLRLEENVSASWRVGNMRLGGIPSSRR